MYQNEYDKLLEYVKTADECVKDIQNIKLCEQNIKFFNRLEAWQCLQRMIKEYYIEITALGLCDNITVYRNIDPERVKDAAVKEQLAYIALRIPIYVLIRKGEEVLAKKIFKWIATKI